MGTNFKFLRLTASVGLVQFFLCLRAGANLIPGSASVSPIADAFLATGTNGNLSADNFGGAGSLAVAAGALPGGQFQTLLRFNLSGAKTALDAQFGAGQWSIFDVILTLTAGPHNNAIFNNNAAGAVNVSLMQNDTWVEGTGTAGTPTTDGVSFNSLPTITSPTDQALGVFTVGSATSGDSLFMLALTPGLISGIMGGSDIDLRLSAADNAVAFLFQSRNDPSFYPLLTVNVVPEPGSIAIGVLGLATFSCLFRGGVRQTRG